jgi:hypothetical protein
VCGLQWIRLDFDPDDQLDVPHCLVYNPSIVNRSPIY